MTFRRKDNSVFEGQISSRDFEDVDSTTSILVTIRDVSNRLQRTQKTKDDSFENKTTKACS